MKKIIYVYVPETVAEWEIAPIMQGISMEKVLKGQSDFEVRTVGLTKEPVKSIGGLTIIPDCVIEEIDETQTAALLLSGAETWNDACHDQVLDLAERFIEGDILVGAICGATLALADRKILNRFQHTSNAVEYLKVCSKAYTGETLYNDSPAVIDKNLVTASSAGGLEWAKLILEYLDVYPKDKILSWYKYFKTGEVEAYMTLVS